MEDILSILSKNNNKYNYFINFPQEMKIINSNIFNLIKSKNFNRSSDNFKIIDRKKYNLLQFKKRVYYFTISNLFL